MTGTRRAQVSSEAPGPMPARLAEWGRKSGCRLLVLFGSGTTAENPGDVDLALQFDELPAPERRLEMIGELQDRCGVLPVDVVFLHRDTDPVLRFEIFRTGVPLLEERPGLFVEETVRALSLYEDTAPFRKLLRESLLDRETRR